MAERTGSSPPDSLARRHYGSDDQLDWDAGGMPDAGEGIVAVRVSEGARATSTVGREIGKLVLQRSQARGAEVGKRGEDAKEGEVKGIGRESGQMHIRAWTYRPALNAEGSMRGILAQHRPILVQSTGAYMHEPRAPWRDTTSDCVRECSRETEGGTRDPGGTGDRGSDADPQGYYEQGGGMRAPCQRARWALSRARMREIEPWAAQPHSQHEGNGSAMPTENSAVWTKQVGCTLAIRGPALQIADVPPGPIHTAYIDAGLRLHERWSRMPHPGRGPTHASTLTCRDCRPHRLCRALMPSSWRCDFARISIAVRDTPPMLALLFARRAKPHTEEHEDDRSRAGSVPGVEQTPAGRVWAALDNAEAEEESMQGGEEGDERHGRADDGEDIARFEHAVGVDVHGDDGWEHALEGVGLGKAADKYWHPIREGNCEGGNLKAGVGGRDRHCCGRHGESDFCNVEVSQRRFIKDMTADDSPGPIPNAHIDAGLQRLVSARATRSPSSGRSSCTAQRHAQAVPAVVKNNGDLTCFRAVRVTGELLVYTSPSHLVLSCTVFTAPIGNQDSRQQAQRGLKAVE
ncbi:uncharacterized protein C8Q71DRAFT_728315 [Rhodofomes roseus]|uniref:Uncharacterized protein n=1 Tax=Rhodofomes roseus TaxID=34475 RepID=A0ABQ8JY24_9APHY|nr:uncharacterized protein C8Q71DRAFT_728315 [Rhodofomes roseus]KAH9829114.1 hypothetical protein C8Q71DRAFT_728315 [Rhodofomes roseus]